MNKNSKVISILPDMGYIAREVKQEIQERIKKGEKVAELSKQYGISEKTIYYWLRTSIKQEVSALEYNKLRRENEDLKAIIGALTFENEKLKKKKR